MLPNKQIAPNTYRFSPDTWTVELTGKPHKANWIRETIGNPPSPTKMLTLTKGNVLIFGDGMIYADHIWRVCKNLDHYQLATLIVGQNGLHITQDNIKVFLKWQTAPRMLAIARAI